MKVLLIFIFLVINIKNGLHLNIKEYKLMEKL